MKYSFMSFSTPTLTLAQMLDLAKKLGYEGIEPRLDGKHAHEVEVATFAARRKELKKQAEDSGVALACVATSCKVADPNTAKQTIEELKARIDLAGDVGSPAIRLFGGAFPDTVSRAAAIDSSVAVLRAVADQAKARGVALCFETHDSWCDPKHVAAIMKKADHPAVAANWDIMHPVRMRLSTIQASFDLLKPWIRHMHVHDGTVIDGKLILKPIGTGEIDHRKAIQLMLSVNYSGFLSGEWISWEPYETHLPRELAIMREYEKNVKS